MESCLEEVGSRYRNRKRPKLPAVECIWVQKPSIRATVASRQTRPLDNTSILGNRSAGKPWGTWICPVDLCVEYLFCQLFNPSCCPPLLPPPTHIYLCFPHTFMWWHAGFQVHSQTYHGCLWCTKIAYPKLIEKYVGGELVVLGTDGSEPRFSDASPPRVAWVTQLSPHTPQDWLTSQGRSMLRCI